MDVRVCFVLQFSLEKQTFDHTCYVIADSPAVPVYGIMKQDIPSGQKSDLMSQKTLRIGKDDLPIANWQTEHLAQPDIIGPIDDIDMRFSVRLCNICTIPFMSQAICWAKLAKAVPIGELGVVEMVGLELN